jgi:prepilin-type N-terminal cleavage/methylation domain-containing protein
VSATSSRRSGFTIAELIVAVTISAAVLLGTYKVLTSQFRVYAQQVAVEDDGETLRGAAAVLGWEIHHAEMATDDILATSPDSLSVRSIQGVGVICVINSATAKYGIWKNGGDIQATSDDSALVYVQATQLWKKMKIAAVGTPAAMSVPSCAWAGVRAPDIVVQLTVSAPADTAGIAVGSIFRSFRRTVFAEYQVSGRWFLSKRVGTGGTWETITGPLLPPADHGLQMSYYDSSGVASTDTTKIREIGVALRAQSFRLLSKSNASAYRVDSVISRVMIRR